jgi:STELLO glycosyltransferases
MPKTALVITSISSPNKILSSCADGALKHGVDYIVVGDVRSPPDFTLSGCDFWSIERQKELQLELAPILPERHYARKNLGYLIALKRGAEVIIETDDDNFPYEAFWAKRSERNKAVLIEDGGWINVYRYFTDSHIWPRGFPLEHIQKPVPPLNQLPEQELFCPIQQGLADDNPDVDAIYRLTMPLPQQFSGTSNIALGRGSWCPFNSQNTTWFKEAFPLLYIPSYCSFRMCDIWRSFVALRICWANDWGVLFHSPSVWQERNEHNLLKDFADEIPGYLNNAWICAELEGIDVRPGKEHLPDNLLACYKKLIELQVVAAQELSLLSAWLEDTELILCC